MDKLQIQPLTGPPHAIVRVPGSKSITNRALVLAAGSSSLEGPSELHGVLDCEDTQVMIDALRGLDVWVYADRPKPGCVTIWGWSGRDARDPPVDLFNLFVGNSGTTMRFLTALVSTGQGRFRLDGVPRMRERPIGDLLAALRQLGVNAYSENGDNRPPAVVDTTGLQGGRVQMRGDVSSQFLSGLLMAAPRARGDVLIEVDGPLVSWPYVAMTVEMMRQFGVRIDVESQRVFRVPGQQFYESTWFEIEPDASAASYFFAAAAIMAGEVRVEGLTMRSLQGDVRFVELLEDMGCEVVRGATGLTVRGGPLHGIDIDMNDISDTVMTLGAVALFAQGPTTIRNVAHIRHKETDRLTALATELRRVGAEVDEFNDGLTIHPRPLHGAEIETYNDHRMAMSMALVGLKVPGIIIKNPGCVAKTYPRFFEDLEKLR